jgi:predicted ATPase
MAWKYKSSHDSGARRAETAFATMKLHMTSLPTGSHTCKCSRLRHETKLVVLTGGPGGGKTAILEMARRYFCRHVVLLPEAASIIFGGGFPRLDTASGKRSAQRAIYRIQRELERMALEPRPAMILCDRGAIDGLAYWPGSQASFFEEFDTTLEEQVARYSAVIHVEVPKAAWYRKNGIRRESVAQARAIDRKIARLWRHHPQQIMIGAEAGFIEKAAHAIELLRQQVPPCCRTHLHTLGGNV